MSNVTDDDLTRWGRLCEAAEHDSQLLQLGMEARDNLPLLIAEIRRLRAELDQRPADRTQLIVDDLREIVERYGSGCVHFELPQNGCCS